jgi:hypothetical protein
MIQCTSLPDQEGSVQSPALEQPDGRPESSAVADFPRVQDVSGDTWFRLAKWAKETNQLAAWQRSLAYSMGRLAALGQRPSSKQTLHGAVMRTSPIAKSYAGFVWKRNADLRR